MTALQSASVQSSMGPLTICFDGGGSKALVQIIDAEGRLLSFNKDGEQRDSIIYDSSNINIVNKE
jgi:hypothetical protein